MRNPLRRDPNRPTLKQRAATLKATAARLIRKPKPLPAAGSPEALAAFGAACRAVDAASRLRDADMEALLIAPGAALWTSDKVMAAQNGDFSRFLPREIEAARAVPKARLEELLILTLHRELRMAEAVQSSRLRELFAQVYGDEPDPAGEDEAPAASEEVDWHSPPPGFMAFPAIEPTGFLNIRYGIVAELERLRCIARAEYARREPYFRDSSFAPGELEAHLSALRDELRLPTLDAAIADPKAPSAGAAADGPNLPQEAFNYAWGLNLSAVPFENLWRLYEVFSAGHELLEPALREDMFDEGTHKPFRTETAGGKILEAEINRLGCLRDAMADELRRRQPRDEAERDARLEVLVTHEMRCERKICSKVLRAEITQAWGA